MACNADQNGISSSKSSAFFFAPPPLLPPAPAPAVSRRDGVPPAELPIGPGHDLAQVFTPALTGSLISMQMPVYCTSGSLHLEIRGVLSGMPDGNPPLATADITAGFLQPFTQGAFHRQLRLPTPMAVTKGTPLAVVLQSTGVCSIVQMTPWAPSNDTRYPFGDAFGGSGGVWSPLSDASRPDLPFQEIVNEGGLLTFEMFGRSETIGVPLTAGPDAGSILFVAGSDTHSTVFNGSTSTVNGIGARQFGHEASMAASRRRHTVTRLSNGRVLAIGGWSDTAGTAVGAIEIFNPATGAWSQVATLATPRFNHIAALLPGGGGTPDRVVIAGGQTVWGGGALSSSEIFIDDGGVSGHIIAGPTMIAPRAEFAAVTIGTGQVALIGGWGQNGGIELYTPGATAADIGSFAQETPLITPRSRHQAVALVCSSGPPCAYGGKVLILGGWLVGPQGAAVQAEIYDPATHTTSNVGVMLEERAEFAADQLPNGKVAIAGGDKHSGATVSSIETFDPNTGLFSAAGQLMLPRGGPGSARLIDGSIVYVGGYGQISAAIWASAEIVKDF